MGISIEDDEVEARIRQLAALRRISLTDAIDQAVTKAIKEETGQSGAAAVEDVMSAVAALRVKYGVDRFRDHDWHKASAGVHSDVEGEA